MLPTLPAEVNKIMRNETEIMLNAQRTIREQLDLRGITLKVVAAKSQIPYGTLCTYFPGNERNPEPKQPVQLPGGAIYSLCGAIPGDLLNLLLPEGFAIVQVPSGIDYDEISAGCREFIDAKERAHHPDSELGRDLGPAERQHLGTKVAVLKAVA